MIRQAFELLRPPSVSDEFLRENREVVLSGLRAGAGLALVFIPSFLVLDYVRLPDHLFGAMVIRLTGSALLLALLPLTYLRWAPQYCHHLTAVGLTIISITVLWIARFASGPSDPVYVTQAVAIVFIIMGAGLLFPIDGLTMLRFAAIPFASHVLFTLDFNLAENLPMLSSTFIAAAIATVGARRGFLIRVGDYEGRRAKEELLRTRSDLVQALTRDLTARKEAESVLRRSERKYRALFEELKDAVILATPEGKVVDVNPAGLELFGFDSAEDFRETDPADFYEDAADRDAIRREITERGFLKDREVRMRRQDGTPVTVFVALSILCDESGTTTGIRMILRDVTQQRLMEARLRQTQKLEAVGLLAAGVAHEINNPLTYVLTDLEILATELSTIDAALDSGKASALLERAREALDGAERVRRIVRDLKTFSRMEDEKRRPVDINEVLQRTIGMASPQIRYRARLSSDLTEVSPVLANEGRLSQVFLNLLINAAQAFDEERPDRNEVQVRSRVEGNQVLVEVADNGRGIAPEHLEKLFDPFFTTKSVGEGSGLGLTICYNIVESFGGRIEVESSPGEGSCFRVRLPAATERPDSPPVLAVDPTVSRLPTRARILVVDDEPFVLSTARLILERNHEVIEAANGREALARLEEDGGVDLILCDLMMREISGMELHAELLERDPQLASRMIFMTGGAFTKSAREFLGRVKNPCIEKPFNASDLVGAIDGAIRGSKPGFL